MMEKDYTIYNQHYQYMERLLNQISGLSKSNDCLYNQKADSVASGADFFSILKDADSKLEVPESMDDIFKEAAEQYDVPLSLLKAIGKAESGFDADAVSSAGAMGVMQLMPGTAKALGVEDAFDARSNIMGGAKYISEKLRQYDGNIELALAAYNAGSGNVAKYGGVPPFQETRNYIRKIKEYMGMDLTADAKVYSRNSVKEKKKETYIQADGRGFDLGNALYLIEMMRVQMQSKMLTAGTMLTNGEDSWV